MFIYDSFGKTLVESSNGSTRQVGAGPGDAALASG